jgi:hypothetical protein
MSNADPSPRPRSRWSRPWWGLGLATVGIVAGLALCSGEPPPTPPRPTAEAAEAAEAVVGPAPSTTPAEPSPVALAGPPAPSSLPGHCDALAALAGEGGPDAVLLAWLCPDAPLDAVAARAALLEVRSPDEAAALVPRLREHPPLQGLARLVAQAAEPPVAALPSPAHAVVSPIDDAVLAQVQRAHAVLWSRTESPAQRTRARALLAKVYLQATQQLGVTAEGRPPAPLARLLAGRALHHGRQLCVAYLQGRIAGLAALVHEVEANLLALVVALDRSPHHGDGGRLLVELEETRRYLQRPGVRDRIARHGAEAGRAPAALPGPSPLPDDLARLLDHGLVDLAIAKAIEAAVHPEGPGLRAVEQHLRDALAHAERGEYTALLEHRLARARARVPPPPEHGPAPALRASDPPWPGAERVADEASAWIERAPPEPGLPRAYALGRALLLVRARPDALVRLLDLATAPEASPALQGAVGWLARELRARDDGRLSWLQRRVAAEPDPSRGDHGTDGAALHEAEAARRRRHALTVREADRQPRGPGLSVSG